MSAYHNTRNFRAMFMYLTLLVVSGGVVLAQATSPMERRIADVGARFSPMPGGYDTLFAASFREHVPASQLTAIFTQMYRMTGSVVRQRITKTVGAQTADGVFETTKGYEVPFNISIDAASPHLIVGLFLRPPVKQTSALDSIVTELRALDGTTSVHIVDLTAGTTVLSYNADKALPLGSTFKLYVLGALVEQIAAGTHRWDEVVTLQASDKSMPSGRLHEWPDGTPLTLQTLASGMISESDNTATDMLIRVVGRKAVESIQSVMGMREPSRNVPFLTTREMFLLKYRRSAELGRRYVTLDTAGRRALLDGVVRQTSLDTLDLSDAPILVHDVEWFATTADVTRALDHLRRRAEAPALGPLLGVLGINPGVDVNREKWTYVGYKGGSEPGVLNLSQLLQRKDGRWFAVSMSWAHDRPVDLMQFSGIMTSAVRLLEDAVPKR